MLLSEAPLNRTRWGILLAPPAARLSQPGTGQELAEMHQGADLADPRAIGTQPPPRSVVKSLTLSPQISSSHV